MPSAAPAPEGVGVAVCRRPVPMLAREPRADAERRGWSREVDRHNWIGARIAELLEELGEPTIPS
jgi:hypothetical protein